MCLRLTMMELLGGFVFNRTRRSLWIVLFGLNWFKK